ISIQNVSSVTLCAGFHRSNPASSEPMKKRPPGMSTIPSGQVVRRMAADALGAPDAGGVTLALALLVGPPGDGCALPNILYAPNPPIASATTASAPKAAGARDGRTTVLSGTGTDRLCGPGVNGLPGFIWLAGRGIEGTALG